MHVREPNTVEEAVDTVIRGMGVRNAAHALGKTDQVVYNWANPTSQHRPSLMQAVALDAAYIARTGGEPPILTWYAEQMGRVLNKHQRMAPTMRLVECFAEMGDVTKAVRDATDPHGPGGTTLTLTERTALAKEINEAVKALQALKRDIEK